MADEPIDNDLLISLVELRPVLWDRTDELYKNRDATRAAWKEILKKLYPNFKTKDENKRQMYAKLLVQRWTHIRDNYHRSCKKIQDQKRSGIRAKIPKPYVYSKQLSFLQKIIQPTQTASNVTNENSSTEFEAHNSDTSDGSEINPIEVTKNPSPKCNKIPKRPVKSDTNPANAKMIELVDSWVRP